MYITQWMIIPEQCVVVDGMKLDVKNGGHPSIAGFNEPSWELAWEANLYSPVARILFKWFLQRTGKITQNGGEH